MFSLPAGLTLGQYLRFSCTALFTMFLGSQVVHNYYRPLNDLNKYIEAEVDNLPDDKKKKVKSELQIS